MKIIHLSDFNCPYSYIGLNRLGNACREIELDADWELRSFELEGDVNNVPAVERLAFRSGLAISDAAEEIGKIEQIALEDGIEMNYKSMSINSSKDAHRLVKHAQSKDLKTAHELVLKIFEANFVENKNIADIDVLTGLGVSCGLDENEIKNILESNSLKIEIDLDLDEALSNGITTIPYYFIEYENERLTVPGVFSTEEFETAFKDLISGKIRDKSFI